MHSHLITLVILNTKNFIKPLAQSSQLKLKKMKSEILKLSTIALLLLFIGASCEKDEIQPLEDQILTVIETNSDGCKDPLKSSETEQYIELKAEGENQLKITFINAVLNCCPGEITSNVFIQNEIFKVVFIEETPTKCSCICDFDLECVIDSMENREYNLEVYAHSDRPKAKFRFNYSSKLNSKTIIPNN